MNKDQLTVACIQQRVTLPASRDELYAQLQRFLRVAANKQGKLVVLPELGGTLSSLLLLDDAKSNLLRRVEYAERVNANLWQKLVGAVSGFAASYIGASLRRNLAALLDVSTAQVWNAYEEIYAELAREFEVTLVAPSAYLPDPLDGVIRNMAALYGPDGSRLGTQSKVVLHPVDVDIAQPGTAWDVIQTDVGRIGLIIGGDVLYPEVGRLLAYQGADILVTQAACLDIAMYNKIRAGVLARMQDNQLFAVASFLVGRNYLTRDSASMNTGQFAGKSAIFAPQELTPKSNGVLVEMGSPRSEGVVAAQWNFQELRNLWETSDTPIRRTLSSAEVGGALGEIYSRIHRLPPVAHNPILPPLEEEASRDPQDTVITLDDLNLIDTYESPSSSAASGDTIVSKQTLPNEGKKEVGDDESDTDSSQSRSA